MLLPLYEACWDWFFWNRCRLSLLAAALASVGGATPVDDVERLRGLPSMRIICFPPSP